ncbi:MAG TPA: hypothetical protein VK419_04930, partial [Bryobacteraceae bacterium]|nr:hypothetical protein [Bryobacteraceae bacterium]
TTTHSAHIETILQADQSLSIQIAYHPGWRATVDGRAVPIRPDGLGLMVLDLMVLDPQAEGRAAPGRTTPGRTTIDMFYDGGTEMRIAHWLCALTSLVLIFVLMRAFARAILKKSW